MRKALAFIFTAAFFYTAHARAWAAAPPPAPSKTAPAASTTTAAAIPLPEIPTRVASASANIRDLQAEAMADPVAKIVDNELPTLTQEIEARHIESSKILNTAPTMYTLRGLLRDWEKLHQTLNDWNRDLARRTTELDNEVQQLQQLGDTWRQTLLLAQSSPDTPRSVIERIQETIDSIQATRVTVEKRRARTLTLQSSVADVGASVDQALANVKKARDQALSRLMVRDSPPIWSAELRSQNGASLLSDSRESLAVQLRGVVAYMKRQPEKFIIHAAVFCFVTIAMFWVRRKALLLTADEPEISGAARIFDAPIATALLLSVFCAGLIYPEAPRLWWAVIGAVGLIPTTILLRKILRPPLFPILDALIAFYFIDRIRLIAAALPIMSRCLFLAEMAAAIGFIGWLLRPSSRRAAAKAIPESVPASGGAATAPSSPRTEETISERLHLGLCAALGILVIAFFANAIGYVGLSHLLGNAMLRSAYSGLTLYAIVLIAGVILVIPLRVGPAAALKLVQHHRPEIGRRIRWALGRAAFLYWVFITLEMLAVLTPIITFCKAVLTTPLKLGTISFTLKDFVVFGVAISATILVSRLIRFVLDEDIYPRVNLPRGIPYAISTMLHYIILVTGFIVGLGALGIDMTKFTILAGAFGVGLGFGLQQILNNFFSGLILLFERPIKIGDLIEIAGAIGVVKRIGIRASVIRTTSGSEVVIPNGNLLSTQFVNWTFSARQRSMELPVSVVRAADPSHVIKLLESIAKAHPQVVSNPPPKVLLDKFSATSLDFTLTVSTHRVEDWMQVRSDLTLAINEALVKEKLAL